MRVRLRHDMSLYLTLSSFPCSAALLALEVATAIPRSEQPADESPYLAETDLGPTCETELGRT